MIDISRLQHLSDARVLVVGDVMLDRYFNGDSDRISPEAPVPVVKIGKVEEKAGGAANVARNIAHLDGRVSLLGLVGPDRDGDSLRAILERENIASELFVHSGAQTIAKMRVISRHQQVVRLDVEQRFSPEQAAALLQRYREIYQDFDVIILSDYDKGSLSGAAEMIRLARDAGKRVLVDPKKPDLMAYAGASIITPNLSEFRLAGGSTESDEAMLVAARRMINAAGIDAMLLTRSEQGMSLITADEHHHFPAQVLEVSDVTGAGDTVIATLAVMLAAGMSHRDAAELANLAAGIVVGKLGAATVSPEELALRLNRRMFDYGEHYQPSAEAVLQHIQFAQQNGEKIVFTNGCFDILHAGHVRYLAEARSLGDRLVVGLNSDDSVRRLKGDGRPVNSLEDRATVLAALASVDWVVPFGDRPDESDTPAQLISKVMPDVLVKGGDYDPLTIVGGDLVRARGGEVRVLSFLEGRSTSAMIGRIRS